MSIPLRKPALFLWAISVILLSSCSKPKPECLRNEDCGPGKICQQARCIQGGDSCQPGEKRACYTGPPPTRGKGLCRDGTQICSDDGTWGKCEGEVLPQREVCDKKDNDCDGQIDEGPAISQEICDGVDNDCDGKIDEGPGGKPLERDCYTGPKGTLGRGACKSGRQVCQNGQWGQCRGQVLPQDEICNNKIDDDCDGKIDNPTFIGKPCTDPKKQGHCQKGTYQCGPDGKKFCKSNTSPKPEVCNGIDEDCDGYIDNAKYGYPEPLSQLCPYTGPKGTLGKGICKAGRKLCRNGKWDSYCTGEVHPKTETCNGLDDDCDGIIDNAKSGSTAPLKKPCYQGPPSTRNKGTCRDGYQICQNGQWSKKCYNQILPQTELCNNGKDEDCDGIPDNVRFLGQPCLDNKRKGRCRRGFYTCIGQNFVCKQLFFPAKEICNGEDDDCDGKIDNIKGTAQPIERDCYTGPAGTKNRGICRSGREQCIDGRWSGLCRNQITPRPELCNKKDDDCDGTVDEDNVCSSCTTGSSRPCYGGPLETRGRGQCSDGTEVCSGGKWGGTCHGGITPKAEICNNLDDNCDGRIDNKPGTTLPLTKKCYSGPNGTKGKGNCSEGIQICKNGNWSNCTGQTLPTTELCNRTDDDCDGLIDEDLVCFKGPRKIGELCIPDPKAPQYRRCGPGLFCLQAWERDISSYCYQTCQTNSDCRAPSGERSQCIILDKNLRICVLRRPEGASCDLTKGIFCQPPAFCDQNLRRCRLPSEAPPLHQCGGNTGFVCSSGYFCSRFFSGGPFGYCLKKCKSSKDCGGGICITVENNVSVCAPSGTQKADQLCGGDKSDRISPSKHCAKGYLCTKFSTLNPVGICLKTVKQCTYNSCPKGRLCISLGSLGVCSKKCGTCPSGQRCQPILGGIKVCTPIPPKGTVPFGGKCSAAKTCLSGLTCVTPDLKATEGVCAKINCVSDSDCPKIPPGARCLTIGKLPIKGCIFPCRSNSDCPQGLSCHSTLKFCLP